MGSMQEIDGTRKPPFFGEFRKNDWAPRFHWEISLDAVTDAINRPHEDYPARILATKEAIQQTLADLGPDPAITLPMLRQIHEIIFPDHGSNAGRWRTTNVQVADHLPPRWEWMDKLMEELEEMYRTAELSLETLRHWYYDFNTIHPMRDGNGRTSGVVIAAFSHRRYDAYLTPGQ